MGYQQILTIAGIMLLSILILNVNTSTSGRLISMYSNEAVISASGIAQALIDEIQTRAYDENTISSIVLKTDSLTQVAQLGKEPGETIPTQFDDIDDYNNYVRTDSLKRMGNFNSRVFVYYVNPNNPDVKSKKPTFTKRIEVHITNFSLPDTLKFYHIVGY